MSIKSFFSNTYYDDQIIDKIVYDVLIPLTNKPFLDAKNISLPKGVMLYGPTGIGKLNLANIIVDILQCSKVVLSPTEIINQARSGKAEISIINSFFKAKQLASKNRSAGENENPYKICCVIIPDLDYIAQKRTSISGYLTASIVTTLLFEIDNLNKENDGTVFIISTSTDISSIDIELRSSSRIGLEIFLPPPNTHTRKKILQNLFDAFSNFDFSLIDLIADETPGFSHADLRSLVELMTKSAVKGTNKSFDSLLEGDLTDLTISEDINLTVDDYIYAKKLIHPSGLRDKTFYIPDIKMSDVYGLTSQKNIINDHIVQYIKHKSLFDEMGLKSIKGIILHGPPGNGKTLLAKAIANEVDWNFILVSGPELLSKYVGESEEQVRELFDRARLYSPCIIFFDEIDSIAPRRDKSQDTHVYASTVGQLLAEIDGIKPLDDVMIMGATNRIELIDPALLREGRIDFKLFVPVPNDSERKEFVVKEFENLESKKRLGKIDRENFITTFVSQTKGFSGSRLHFILTQASRIALKENNYSIDTLVEEKHFNSALNNYTINEKNLE